MSRQVHAKLKQWKKSRSSEMVPEGRKVCLSSIGMQVWLYPHKIIQFTIHRLEKSLWDLYICFVHSLGILLQSRFNMMFWTEHSYNLYVSGLAEEQIVGWDCPIPLKGSSPFGVHYSTALEGIWFANSKTFLWIQPMCNKWGWLRELFQECATSLNQYANVNAA